MHVRRAPSGIEIWLETKEQHVLQITEDRLVHRWIPPFGGADRALHDLTIFFTHRLTRREVGSINRKTGDSLAHRTRKRLEREIAVPTTALGKPIEHVAQNIDVVRQCELHNLQFFRIQEMAKRNRVTDETMERFCDRLLGRRI